MKTCKKKKKRLSGESKGLCSIKHTASLEIEKKSKHQLEMGFIEIHSYEIHSYEMGFIESRFSPKTERHSVNRNTWLDLK